MARALASFAFLCCLSLTIPAVAQDLPKPAVPRDPEIAVAPVPPEVLRQGLWRGSPAFDLQRSESFAFGTSFGWIYPGSTYLPPFRYRHYRDLSPRARYLLETDRPASADAAETMRKKLFYTAAEVDFEYGRMSGRYGGELMRGYVTGEVGNEYFSLRVGVGYSDWDGRYPGR